MITTIEGVIKAELQARCVAVQYGVPGERLQRGAIEREIMKLRHQMGSALVRVPGLFLQIRDTQVQIPTPIANFQEHFAVLCNLLRAFGMAADRPDTWSEDIIAQWNTVILGTEADDDDLEHPLGRVLRECEDKFVKAKLSMGAAPARCTFAPPVSC